MALHLAGFYPTAPRFQRRRVEGEPYEGELDFNDAVGIWQDVLFNQKDRQFWFDDTETFLNHLYSSSARYQTLRRQDVPLRFEVTTDDEVLSALAMMVSAKQKMAGELEVVNVYASVGNQEMNIGALAIIVDPEEIQEFTRYIR